MPYLIQQRVRARQPQQAVGINWSNPITKGLVDVIDMRGDPRSVILGTPPTFFGSSQTYSDPTPSGLAFSTLASVGGVAFIRSDGLYAPAEQSHVALAEYSISAGGWAGLFASSAGDGASGSFGLQRSYEGNCYIPGTAEPYLPIYYDITGTGQNLIALTGDSVTSNVYKNGNLISSVANAPIPRSTSRLVLSGERSASAGYAHQSRQVLHLFYNRAITADEVQSLQANVWQIFEDEDDYIWVPDVAGGYTATGAVSGSGSIVTGAATKTQVYSGSGAVAGTGATVTGAATRSFDSTGTVAGSGAIVTGSATNTQPSITSTGAVAGQGAIVSGAATRQFSSTGAVSGQGATVTGAATKTQVYSSTGAVVGGGAVVSGTATNTPLGISAYGDVAGQGSIVSGVATRAFTATGAVVGAVATVAGTATRAFTATGAIAGYTAVITGAATNTPLGINGYGSVSGQGASVSGAATITAVFTATGAVVGAGATITGYATNVRVLTSSGVISGQGATVAGAAIVSGITVWPLASDVRRGINYGPTGNDYTGTLSVGTGSGGGMNVTLSEPRLSVVSRDNSVYVIHETQRKIFS